jgi:putative CRISPR-associated protein (TIGR02619 family)
MRHTLICTVGTSLLNNLKRESEEIKALVQAQNWTQLSLWLLGRDNTSRVCGAEINSITSICNKGFLEDRKNLIFLVSDTDDGRYTGQLLKSYYKHQRNSIYFNDADFRVLNGLRDDSVELFKREGLKNLVKEISKEVRKWDSSSIAINATGGYKAQISFAGMVGQALDIPVYYLFEKFSEVIALPPQPISLDLGFWLNNYVSFKNLEEEGEEGFVVKTAIEFDWNDERISALVEKEDIDGTQYVTLSAMGILFNERSRLQFARQQTAILSLIPQDDTPPQKKTIKLRDDHGKDTLQSFSKRLCQSPYVIKVINSLPFNSHRDDPILNTTDNGIIEFVLTWTDKGLGVCIQTTGRNIAETNSIALYLKEKFTQ